MIEKRKNVTERGPTLRVIKIHRKIVKDKLSKKNTHTPSTLHRIQKSNGCWYKGICTVVCFTS